MTEEVGHISMAESTVPEDEDFDPENVPHTKGADLTEIEEIDPEDYDGLAPIVDDEGYVHLVVLEGGERASETLALFHPSDAMAFGEFFEVAGMQGEMKMAGGEALVDAITESLLNGDDIEGGFGSGGLDADDSPTAFQ